MPPEQITGRDDLTAALAEIHANSERPLPHVTNLPISHDGVRYLMESAADVPRLLAAVDAVLKVAEDWATERPGDHPAVTACGRSVREAISCALTGEGAS